MQRVSDFFDLHVEHDGSDILISKVKFLMSFSIIGYSMKEVSSLEISEVESLRSGSHMIFGFSEHRSMADAS